MCPAGWSFCPQSLSCVACRPYIIKSCYQNLPYEYAPCLIKNQTNAEAAEEVVGCDEVITAQLIHD